MFLWLTVVCLSIFIMSWGGPYQAMGLIMPAALLIAIETTFSGRSYADLGLRYSSLKPLLSLFGALFLCYALAASTAGASLINSAVDFGGIPRPLAYPLVAAGLGLEGAVLLFFSFVLPAWLLPRRGGFDLPARWLWAAAVDLFFPRYMFQWSWGEWTLEHLVWVSQAADLLGGPGLGLIALAPAFALLALWRRWGYRWRGEQDEGPSLRGCILLVGGATVLWIAAAAYGAVRLSQLDAVAERDAESGSAVPNIVLVQPNFPVSGPRQAKFNTLIGASERALRLLPADTQQQSILVWPESVFPYSLSAASRAALKKWSDRWQVEILLNAIAEPTATEGRRMLAALVSPAAPMQEYTKVSLIPFGEYVPFAAVWPSWGQWFRRHVVQLTDFSAGDEAVVFQAADGWNFAPLICFDIQDRHLARQAADRGADALLLLANLIWFGVEDAELWMGRAARWRAIENRLPVLMASQNGPTLSFDSAGREQAGSLPANQSALGVLNLPRSRLASAYSRYGSWFEGALAVLAALAAGFTFFVAGGRGRGRAG